MAWQVTETQHILARDPRALERSLVVEALDVIEGREPSPDGAAINARRSEAAASGDALAYELWSRLRWRWLVHRNPPSQKGPAR